jgi:hypothetical protein
MYKGMLLTQRSALGAFAPVRHPKSRRNCPFPISFHRVLDSSHLALVAHAVYWYTISNFGDYGVLLNEVW